jgi:outer membrane lipoprotein-sorting protein
MTRKGLLILTGFLFFFLQISGAQDLKETLWAMRSALKNVDQMHIVMHISVFENKDKQKQVYSDRVEINRDHLQCFYRYNSSEFLMNDRYTVMVDKTEQEIIWTPTTEERKNHFDKKELLDMDSILSLYDNPEFISREKDTDHFKINQKDGAIKQIDLSVNNASHLLQRMEYLYANGQLVLIEFEKFDLKPVFELNLFNETKYLQIKGQKATPAQQYKYYRVNPAFPENQ